LSKVIAGVKQLYQELFIPQIVASNVGAVLSKVIAGDAGRHFAVNNLFHG
jgi:hypothetical protein